MKKLLLVFSTLVFCAGALAMEKIKPSQEGTDAFIIIEEEETALPTLPAKKLKDPKQGTAEDYSKELEEQEAQENKDKLTSSVYEEEEEIPVTVTQDSIREVIIDEDVPSDLYEEEGLTETEILSDRDLAEQQKLRKLNRKAVRGPPADDGEMSEEEEEDVRDLNDDEEDKSKEVFSGVVAQATPASFPANEHGPMDHSSVAGEKGARKSLFLNDYAPDKSQRMFGISVIDSRSSTAVTGNTLLLQTPESPLGNAVGNPEYVNEVMSGAGFNIAGIETDNIVDLIKLDAWIFPFMNIYALGGHISGHAKIATNFSDYDPGLALYGANEDMTFAMDYSGNNYGGGVTLAAPLGAHFFVTVDYNYLRTDLDVLKGHVKAETITALLGAHLSSRVNVFAGAQRIDIEQRVQGPIPNAMLPEGMSELMIGNNATFTMNADSAKDILPVVGGSFAFNEHFNGNLTANFNKNGRFDGQNLSLGYRF